MLIFLRMILIPCRFIKKNWTTLYDVHKQLGIEVDQEKAKEVLENAYYVPKEVDPDTYNEPSFVIPVYGDTDSLYISYENLLKTIKGVDKKLL